MKRVQLALGVMGGYVLGRFRKMRWALTLAGAAAGRRRSHGSAASGLLRSLEMERLAERLSEDVRHELLTAGRAAAVAAVGHRMDTLSDKMRERASSLRSPVGGGGGGAESGGKHKGRAEDIIDEDRPLPRSRSRTGRPSSKKSRTERGERGSYARVAVGPKGAGTRSTREGGPGKARSE